MCVYCLISILFDIYVQLHATTITFTRKQGIVLYLSVEMSDRVC